MNNFKELWADRRGRIAIIAIGVLVALWLVTNVIQFVMSAGFIFIALTVVLTHVAYRFFRHIDREARERERTTSKPKELLRRASGKERK